MNEEVKTLTTNEILTNENQFLREKLGQSMVITEKITLNWIRNIKIIITTLVLMTVFLVIGVFGTYMYFAFNPESIKASRTITNTATSHSTTTTNTNNNVKDGE